MVSCFQAHVRSRCMWLNLEHSKNSNRSKKNPRRRKSNSNLLINSQSTTPACGNTCWCRYTRGRFECTHGEKGGVRGCGGTGEEGREGGQRDTPTPTPTHTHTHQHTRQHPHIAHQQRTQRTTHKRTTHNTQHRTRKESSQALLTKICPRRVIT